MAKKKVLLRTGNFTFTQESGQGYDWIAVKAESGFWTMRFRKDNPTYTRLQMIIKDESIRQYLDSWVKIMFCYTNITPDLDLLQLMYKGYTDFMDRQKELYKSAKEDEEKIIRDMKLEEEMKEELSDEE